MNLKDKHILVVFLGTHNAGPVYSYEMVKGLLENGVNVSAIISTYSGNIENWRKLPLRKLVEIPTYRDKKEFLTGTIKFLLYGKFDLKKEFQNDSFDAIYSPFFSCWGHWAINVFSDMPLIYTIHDPILHSGESFINRFMDRLVIKDILAANKVIVLSSIFQDYVIKRYHKNADDVLVLPHGTFETYDEQEQDHTEASKWYSGHKASTNFVFFGRIEEYKGIDLLLEAYKAIEDSYHDKVSLLIAGKGDFSPYQAAFDNLRNVKLMNYMIPDEEVMSFFRGNNVITVLPYKDATQSGVINLAAQSGSLVISTNVGGLPEQLDDGKAGILTEPTVQGLVDAMKKGIENKQDDQHRIAYAKAKVGTLTWKKLAEKLLHQI